MQVPLEVTLDFWSVANYTMLVIHVEIIRHVGHTMMCRKETAYRFIGSWLNVNPCQSHPKSISQKNKEHLRFEVWKFQHHWPYCFVQIWFAQNPSISQSSFINEHTDQTLDTSFQVIIGIAVTMPLIHGSLWCISMMTQAETGYRLLFQARRRNSKPWNLCERWIQFGNHDNLIYNLPSVYQRRYPNSQIIM